MRSPPRSRLAASVAIEFPVFAGVTYAYQPFFISPAREGTNGETPREESVGATSLTFNVGVYVPLFDFN